MDLIYGRPLTISLLFILFFASLRNVYCGEKLALLSATLRTYQKVACDTDQVVISCPRGTSISIEFAQYNKFLAKDGITIEQLCPLDSQAMQIRSKSRHLLRGSTFGSPTQTVPASRYVGAYATIQNIANEAISTSASNADQEENIPEHCLWPNALQYSLLQTVVEACQKKKHCKFDGSPQYYGLGASGRGDARTSSSVSGSSSSSTTESPTTISSISVDPCPKRRKIVEIAYKCRPYEFRSKVACHNEVAQLECNPYSRIAVYSASFGRTEYESIQCPQPQGVKEETCLASFATETVMQICHGRRKCNLAADANTFGNPCHQNSRMYLKVVYTCVPKQVLKDRYETDLEADEADDYEGDIIEVYDDDQFYKESEAIPKLYTNVTNTTRVTMNATTANNYINGTFSSESDGGINPVMTRSSDLTLEDDQERFYVYLLIAGSAGVVVCIIIVAIRILFQNHRSLSAEQRSSSALNKGKDDSKAPAAETVITNGFNDAISEIDGDIDLTTPIPLPSVSQNEKYVTYVSTSGLYGSMCPSSISHTTSSTLLLQSAVNSGGLGSNSLMCGPGQSPDIIGSNFTIVQNSASVPNSILGSCSSNQPIGNLILNSATPIDCRTQQSTSSNAVGTILPVTSLAEYTTTPTFRTGYIINAEGTPHRPSSISTPPTSISSAFLPHSAQSIQPSGNPHRIIGSTAMVATASSQTQLQQQQQQQQKQQQQQQQQQQYDGTAPRTLSTGIPINSQFYYG